MGTTPLFLFSPARSWTCDNVADMAVIMTTPFFRVLLAARSFQISCSITYITDKGARKNKRTLQGNNYATTAVVMIQAGLAPFLLTALAERPYWCWRVQRCVFTRRKGSIRFQRSRNNGFPLIYLGFTSCLLSGVGCRLASSSFA